MLSRPVFPDTVDYWMVSEVEAEGLRTRTRIHVIQAGSDFQRVEITEGPQRIQMIRNGGKTLVRDLAAGTEMVLPSATDPLSLVRDPLAGGEWSEPFASSDGNWIIRDTAGHGGDGFRELEVSGTSGRVVRMLRSDPNGDSAQVDVEWGSVQGGEVVLEIGIEAKSRGVPMRTRTRYGEWSFPRSFPSGFFAIP